jgi:hypothetical protein
MGRAKGMSGATVAATNGLRSTKPRALTHDQVLLAAEVTNALFRGRATVRFEADSGSARGDLEDGTSVPESLASKAMIHTKEGAVQLANEIEQAIVRQVSNGNAPAWTHVGDKHCELADVRAARDMLLAAGLYQQDKLNPDKPWLNTEKETADLLAGQRGVAVSYDPSTASFVSEELEIESAESLKEKLAELGAVAFCARPDKLPVWFAGRAMTNLMK